MPFPTISALSTGVLVILLMGLGFYTSMGRLGFKQSLGHGDNRELEKRVRTHGNLAEHAPIVLLALALIEMSGADRRGVAILALWFVIARMLHVLGLLGKSGPNTPRFLGSASTYVVGMLAGAWLIVIALPRI
jgi:hypothetical protein